MKKFLYYFFGAVGGYLVLTNYTGFEGDLATTGTAADNFTETLQGR